MAEARCNNCRLHRPVRPDRPLTLVCLSRCYCRCHPRLIHAGRPVLYAAGALLMRLGRFMIRTSRLKSANFALSHR